MITTELYNGQGPGDQLWVYLVTRYIAHTKGYEFGIGHPERWKLKHLNVDFGKPVEGGLTPKEGGPPAYLPDGIKHYYREKHTYHPDFVDCNVSDVDPDLLDVEDNTKLEGLMHYSCLIEENRELFMEWLGLWTIMEKNPVSYGKLIVNIRGGEYKSVPDLILPKKYWDMAIDIFDEAYADIEIVTDDPEYAKLMVPQGKIFKGSVEDHFNNLFTADKIILSNSAFGFFPAALGDNLATIAPKYWSRWNVSDGFWAMEMDKFDEFWYMDKDGIV